MCLRSVVQTYIPRFAKMIQVIVEAAARRRLVLAVDRDQQLVFQLLVTLTFSHQPPGSPEKWIVGQVDRKRQRKIADKLLRTLEPRVTKRHDLVSMTDANILPNTKALHPCRVTRRLMPEAPGVHVIQAARLRQWSPRSDHRV